MKILTGKEKGRKESFEKSALEKSEYQILHLMPKVLNKLQESGHIVEFCNFIRLVSEDKFPLRNISWLLFGCCSVVLITDYNTNESVQCPEKQQSPCEGGGGGA